MSVKDARFVDYVNEKLSQYEEGELMETDQLMTLTANKYKKHDDPDPMGRNIPT